MKKKLLEILVSLPFLSEHSPLTEQNRKLFMLAKLKLTLVLFFIYTSLWAQPPHTFTADGSVVIPAGIVSMDIQAWGAGGAGGGASNSGLLNGRSGGGGGGGAYAHGLITVNPLSGVPLSIKVATATTGTTSTVVSGGSSTIQGFEGVILAVGGVGGTAHTSAAAAPGGAGGLGSDSIGSISTASGANGGNGSAALLSAGLSSGAGGTAGGAGGGTGGASLSTALLGNGPGNNGNPPGGGGSGALHTGLNSAQAGGSGAHGQVIVTYTCPTYNITGISADNVCITSPTSLVTVTASAALLPAGIYTVTYSRGTPAATGLTASMTVNSAGTGSFTAVGLTTAGTSSITVTGLTSGVCTSAITGITTNVTISPVTVQGSVSGGTTICNGATSALLSLTGNTGSVVRWEFSITPFSTWTPIVNTATTYTSGALTETTEFRAVVQSGICSALNSALTTVTVNPLPQGSLSANGPFCATGAGQLTFTATAGTGPYTVVYNDGTANRTANSVVSGTPFATFTTPVTSTTTYTLVSVTDANTCIRSSGFTGSSATITINPLPQGSLSANGPFCVTGAGQLTFTATAGTGPYTIVYNDGTANRTANSVVSGTPFATFTTPVTSTTTYTLVSVTDTNTTCARSSSFTGSSAAITVNPLPQGSLSANGPFCATGAGQLTFTATAGTGPYTVVYNDGTANRTANSVVSGTPFATFTTPVTSTTTYTLVSVTDTNTTCARSSSFTGSSATITVNPLPQGSLSANGPFCATGAGQLTFTATAGTGPYTVVYNDGTANRTANSVVSGTPFATFTTPVTSTTTYTLVSVTDTNTTCARSSSFTGSSATITVNPLPQGSLSANGPFCATGAGQLTFTATAGTGPYTVVYNDGTANCTANSVVSGNPFATFTTPVTSTTTYTLVSVTDTNTTCVRSSSFTGSSATITVNPLPQGSLSANGPFCATGAGQLTFTATAGTGPYTIVYNDGTANRTANSVVSGTPFATFTTPVTSTTTYTLVSVTDTNTTCARSSSFTGGSATITVNPLPQGSLSANGPFCATGAGQLTFTATAGTGPYTVVYNDGTANRTANSVVSGTPFATFTTPVTSTTTYTLVSVTDTNTTCARSSSFTGSSATITVNPLPQGSLSANGPFCATGAGQLTFTATAGTGPYTVVYNDGTANRTANSVVSGTPFATFTTPVTSTTTYTLVSVTDTNTTCARSSSFTGSSATITVNPLPQGSLSANGPFCATGAGQLTFTATAGIGPYTVVYNDGTANRTANSVVSGTPFATFTTPVTSTTTYTLVSVTGALSCVRSTGFTGGSATITVNPLPQGSLSANGPFCATGAGQLTFTATAGTGPYTVVYNDGTANRTANSVVSGTPFATFITPVTSTTTYTLVSVTDTNTTCARSSSFTGSSATITVNPLPQGSLSANGPFCATGAGQLTFTATAGTGPYTVVYNDGTANRTANSVVSGTPFATFTTPVTSTTTYTLVSVTDTNTTCARSSSFTGSSAAITVNPLPQGSLSANGPFCATGAGQLTFTATAGTGPYTVVYNDGTANRTANSVVSGTPFATFTTPVTSTTTYTLVSVTDTNTTCARSSSFTGSSAAITVNPLPQGSLSANGPFCATGAGQLTFTATAGTGPYTVVYNDGTANRTANSVVSGTPFATFITPVTSTTTYTLVSVTDTNTTCARSSSFTGSSATITVNSRPTTPVPGTPVQPTCVNATGSIPFSGLLPASDWIINQSGTSSQSYTGSGTTYTVTNLAPGTYFFTIQDVTNCPSLPTAGIEITSPIINIWNGLTWSKGSPPISTDSVEFAGNYVANGDLSACSCIVHPGVNVTVKSNQTLTIQSSVNNDGGTLTFEDGASLLQVNNTTNTGNIIYKRNTTPVRRYDFTYWTSPVTRTPDFTLYDLSPNTLGDKYSKYNPLNDKWITIYNGAAPMVPCVGYNIRAPQSYDTAIPSVYNATFIGVPNNGPYAVSLVAAEKWSLIGNPYPSAIYADQFIVDNTANIYGTLYFWTHNSPPAATGTGNYTYTSNDFAIYNLSGSVIVGDMTGDGATTPGNQNPPLGYIAAGQAFFVKSKTGQNAVFTNSMRIPGSNSQFFKSTNSKLERHRVWLNLTNTQGAFKQVLIGYIEGATNGWDTNYDGISLDANKFLDFYSVNGDLKLVVQGRALPFLDTDFVPLGYRSAIAGDFTIAIDHTDGLLSTEAIYLEDKKLGVTHDLRASNYTFTTAIGTFTDRFVLRYGKKLGVDDFEKNEDNIIAFVKNKNIKITSFKDALNEVVIYDISGKIIYDKKKIGNTELQISNLPSEDQILFLKVILENGYSTSRKIVF
ncbi:T9SS sorting signal type C domain-containing protein [uncultured Flavobacterium sp.]|uniref:T9SS sorting signal type C domain-containing protein n=1 Tax=uncultured Flavobacterium sp. TaxID=165435 RepID=UPI00292F2CED|nr:T9SS sorting signal type C domain-containing protein [uncultured Flavobacterium sp.]